MSLKPADVALIQGYLYRKMADGLSYEESLMVFAEGIGLRSS